jgi:hypothetical protein
MRGTAARLLAERLDAAAQEIGQVQLAPRPALLAVHEPGLHQYAMSPSIGALDRLPHLRIAEPVALKK